MNELWHSAKGTSWSKKDHKYIKKEGDKYYYKVSEKKSKKLQKKYGDIIEKYKDTDFDAARENATASLMAEKELTADGKSFKDVDPYEFVKTTKKYREQLQKKKAQNQGSEKVSKETLNSGNSVASVKSIVESSYDKIKNKKVEKNAYKAPTYEDLLRAYLSQRYD